MEIRRTELKQIDEVAAIYDRAREFMRQTGNPDQWGEGYPSKQTLRRDIECGGSYVVMEDGRVVATFFFAVGEDPTYGVIEKGRWLNHDAYGVVHRVASDGSSRGMMHRILDFCFGLTGNIRIDTHRDNRVMRSALLSYGFSYCGIIHLADGSERLAYQLTVAK